MSERIEIPPPAKLPSMPPSARTWIAFGSIIVALANAPGFIAWATPKTPPPPAASKEEIESLRVDIRALQLTLTEMRKELEPRIREIERAQDRQIK